MIRKGQRYVFPEALFGRPVCVGNGVDAETFFGFACHAQIHALAIALHRDVFRQRGQLVQETDIG